MVLAPLQKLKIKYELSYQSTTRLKYIDKFDQLLIIHQWTSTVTSSSTPFPNYDDLQVLKTVKYWLNPYHAAATTTTAILTE
jgi:hypothetical protein